jgi:ProP effector
MENLHSVAEADTQPTLPVDAAIDVLTNVVANPQENELGTTPETSLEIASDTVTLNAPDVAVDAELAADETASETDTADTDSAGTDAAKPKAKTLHPRTILNILADRYPAAFHADGRLVRPLAVGVLKELQAAREGENPLAVSMPDLRRALRYYTQGAAYHRAVARGDGRINLLGEDAGEVTEDQKTHAAAKLVELEPKLPKRPERAPRPALVGDSAPSEAGAEGATTAPRDDRARRERNPADRRPAARGEGGGRDRDRGNAGRGNAGHSGDRRAPREDRRAAPKAISEQAAPTAKIENNQAATAAPLDMNDKLSLLVAKFGR